MTTAGGRLDAIRAVLDKVIPLGGRQRGEPIEADQWNGLVAALIGILEIDRAQEVGLSDTLTSTFATANHQHLGQVSLPWLAVDLQDQVVAGGAGSVSVRGALADLTARLNDLSGLLSALSARVETIQKRSDDTAVDELGRSAKLRGFETRFAGVEDLRGIVTSTASSVQGLQSAVQTVLELRAQLRDAEGVPIDVRALGAHVDTIDTAVQDATLGVDGTPLRMRDLQVRLSDLEGAAAPDGPGLDQRFADLSAQIDQKLAALDGQVEQRLSELSQSVDDRLAGQADALVAQVVAQVTDPITESVLGKVSDQLAQLVDARIAGQLGEIRKVLTTFDERISRLEKKVFG